MGFFFSFPSTIGAATYFKRPLFHARVMIASKIAKFEKQKAQSFIMKRSSLVLN